MLKINLIDSFKQKIRCGPVYGPFAKTSDPAIVECAGHAGFDFIILDMEHGPNGVETVQNLVRAAQLTGLLPIVRVEEDNPTLIGKVLDIGAGGIEVPQVNTGDDLRRVLEHARFAPEGMRGVCRFVRAADYSTLDRGLYFSQANQAVIVIHVEGARAIENLDDLLEVGGFDVLFIGPYDLSQSLGVPGQVDHPLVQQEMRRIIDRCRKREVCIGTFADTPEAAARWIAAGVRYMAYSVDVGIFTQACRTIVDRLKRP